MQDFTTADRTHPTRPHSGSVTTEAPHHISTQPEPIPGTRDDPAKPRIGIRAAWPAIAAYAALRAVGLLTFWYVAAERHRDAWGLLGKFDADWYAGIATRGYDLAIPLKADGTLATTNLAFFPLYPAVTAVFDPVLPGDARTAGIIVAWLAGLAAAWGLYAVGAQLRDRRTGVLLAALWAIIPHALVESMGYTETLFTALSAWSLFALLRRSWLTAGLLCALAGLTRPTGAALAAAIGVAALLAVIRRKDGWRPWLAGILAPLGFLGYIAWVGHRLGRADGYFHVQNDAWKMGYDDGSYTVRQAITLVTGKPSLAYVMGTFAIVAAIVLVVALSKHKQAWPLTIYSLAIIAMAFFGDSYYHSKGRLLIPAFPLLLPIAAALGSTNRRTLAAVLTLLTAVSTAYGVYVLLFWTYSP
ncbi:glycosyltransferase family 39 protein [Asanoa sp. NPDC050611]|uniref:glycosyltransferase family 39 protein n=1 Tax=Asanoa sp. NPDC050611 TaxID=3157098 RepID=UPI0033F668F2